MGGASSLRLPPGGVRPGVDIVLRLARPPREGRPLGELVPWMLLLDTRHILLKDGSLLSVLAFEGIDFRTGKEDARDRHTERLDRALELLGENTSLWWSVDRHPATIPGGHANECGDSVSARLEELHTESLRSPTPYQNVHHLSLITPPDAPFGAPGGGEEQTHGRPARLRRRFLAPLSHRSLARFEESALLEQMARHDAEIAVLNDLCPELHWRPLTGADLAGFLHDRLGLEMCPQVTLAERAYLDDTLADSFLDIARGTLVWSGPLEQRYGVVLSLRGWPRGGESATRPGCLDELLTLNGTLRLSLAFRRIPNAQAEAWISKVQRHHLLLARSWRSYLREALTRERGASDRPQHEASVQEAVRAQASLAHQHFGYVNVTVVCYGRDPDEAEATAQGAVAALHRAGMLCIRERLHALGAWAGTLPGQWWEPVRWSLVGTSNLADLAPTSGEDAGQPMNAYLTRQVGRPIPALATFRTARGGLTSFNLHVDDLGHTLVLGPSRSGKSVFVNFLIASWQKYRGRTYIFDRDHSCLIPTVLQGGSYLDLENENEAPTLNPLQLLAREGSRAWLLRWILGLLGAEDPTREPEAERCLAEALEALADLPGDRRRLLTLAQLLPRELAARLTPWLERGASGGLFDHVEDRLVFGTFTAVDLGTLLGRPGPARFLLDYLFERIRLDLDGQPTLIYIEEAWAALTDPQFAPHLETWLRTLAKRNACLILATQSLSEIARSPAASVLLENAPTRILLPNPHAHAQQHLYRELLGLGASDLDRIAQATPHRHYFVRTPRGGHVLDVRFPPALLAHLRSDARALRRFEEARRGGEAWAARYLESMNHDS